VYVISVYICARPNFTILVLKYVYTFKVMLNSFQYARIRVKIMLLSLFGRFFLYTHLF